VSAFFGRWRVHTAAGRPGLALAVLLAGVQVAAGCAGGALSLAELPANPIAVTFWEPEAARRRAELAERRESTQRSTPRRTGVAEVEALGRLLGAASPGPDWGRFPGRLSLVDPHSGRVTPLSAAPPGAVPLAWSDDRKRLLFLSNHRDKIQIYEYDRELDEVRAITQGQYQHLWGDYGRERQIAVLQIVTDASGAYARIFVTDANGAEPQLAIERIPVENMRLSPDGSVLLYVRDRSRAAAGRGSKGSDLVALDLGSGTQRVLALGREPVFSPAGDWIVYSAPTPDGWRLRRMRTDGSARAPLGLGVRDETMPSVSPDGRFVVYVGEVGGLDQLFVRRIDGSGNRILLDIGAAFAPAW
jgi:Tol biopolymer transport system component